MATAESVKSKLQGLIDQANAATGNTDADLTTAVGRLIAGFGQGGGSLIVGAENLHDSSTDTENVYINNGVEQSYSGWRATDYIPINAGTVYAVKIEGTGNISGSYCALYDSGKNFTQNFGGGFQNPTNGATLFVGVSGYIRFSAANTNINNLKVYECTGSLEFASAQSSVAVLSDDIPAEITLDILTGGGPEE